MERFETVPGSLAGLVTGEVVTCEKHPQADKLSLTRVDVGGPELLSIVCGAPNVAAGQKVVVAPVGCTLYGFAEPLTIRKAKIRGEVSEGMICAEDEIGIGNDHSGIIVLPNDIQVGLPVSSLFEAESDSIFEIGLTPNRIDSASHYGVARELMAALGQERKLELRKPSVQLPPKGDHMPITVTIGHREACIRYSGISITGVTVGESPQWLSNRLRSIGMAPINNIVDITNLVLHETGQPLHAFDAEAITGNQVIVKPLAEGTKFITLDQVERTLSQSDLMICNDTEGMCMAGVFGGIRSGVTQATRAIFLESACFNPVWIRRTSKRHQLFTDSSFRFERGTDPNGTVDALLRAASLICEIAGGTIASEVVDVYPDPVKPYPVFLKWSNLDRLIGISIDREVVRKILDSIDIRIEKETDEGLHLAVATYRVDVRREADVIEDILRIYGYNNIGMPDRVTSTLAYGQNPDPDLLENQISDQLTALGFNEMMANSLTRSAYYDHLPSFPEDRAVKLLNPLSSDLGTLRRTLLFGGLEAITTNANYKNPDLRLYEFGFAYHLKPGGNRLMANGYEENRLLALWLTGKKQPEHWSGKAADTGYFDLKGYIELILKRFGLTLNEMELSREVDERFAHGVTYRLGSAVLITMGMVHPDILERTDTEQTVWFAEINWDLLLAKASFQIRFQEMPRFPWVRRDLALVVDQTVGYDQIRSLAYQVERKLLKEVNVFDVYTSDKLGQGKKSLAVSFILQDETKTLTDKQIDQTMDHLIRAFQDRLGAGLRE
jgi:phenylalanyl-tRNA synthetase beta chain